jgi:hypothetical protein
MENENAFTDEQVAAIKRAMLNAASAKLQNIDAQASNARVVALMEAVAAADDVHTEALRNRGMFFAVNVEHIVATALMCSVRGVDPDDADPECVGSIHLMDFAGAMVVLRSVSETISDIECYSGDRDFFGASAAAEAMRLWKTHQQRGDDDVGIEATNSKADECEPAGRASR